MNLTIFPQPASTFLVLRAEMWEDDGFFGGGDDFKGESLPNITQNADIASFDPFNQTVWAAYQVAVNQ